MNDPRDAVVEAASKLAVWVDIYCNHDWDGVEVYYHMKDANAKLTAALAEVPKRRVAA